MSTTPPGWYQDPDHVQGLRWWDGTGWTDDRSAAPQPYTAEPAPLRAPDGADWRTPWIWLVLLVPLIPALGLFFIDWRSMLAIDPVTGEADPTAQFAVLASPGYLLNVVGGWVAYGLSVFFAYRDWSALRDRGVPQPFHWAWTFLSGYVYAIGRAVVTKRRGAGGAVVLWIAIAMVVAGVIGAFVFTGWIFATVFEQIAQSPAYSS